MRFPFAGHATSTSVERETKCVHNAKHVSNVSRVINLIFAKSTYVCIYTIMLYGMGVDNLNF